MDLLDRVEALLEIVDGKRRLGALRPLRVPNLGLVGVVYLSGGGSPYEEGYHVVVPEEEVADPERAIATLEERVALLRSPGALLAAKGTIEQLLGIARYAPGADRFVATPEVVERRSLALADAFARHDSVADWGRSALGVRVPRHLAVFAAFVASLDELEAQGLESTGIRASGLALAYRDGGLDRKTRDGLDARLDWRFRRDPPELVTVAHGDTDGLHFGLWFDDPNELPSFIASNYARDTAETREAGSTMLDVLRDRLASREADELAVGPPEDALAAAIEWFETANARAIAEDGTPRWRETARGAIVGGIGPALPAGSGDPRLGASEVERRARAYRSDPALVQRSIDEARAALAEGEPAFALVLGRELFWSDQDATREAALELLTRAYESLGRHGLSEIARVHHRHRDLASVEVFE